MAAIGNITATHIASARYHITTRPAPPPAGGYPAPFAIAEDGNYVKYGHEVFAGKAARGDDYWTAEIITQTWYMAETGRIPISGAGYGGKFAGEGFDGIWLDMSEIVRPTRDGIHGRETISTAVDLGAGAPLLEFDADGALASDLPAWLSLPTPVIFNPLPEPLPGRGTLLAMARAAKRLGTLAVIAPEDYAADLDDCHDTLAVRLAGQPDGVLLDAWQPRYVEIEASAGDVPALAASAAARWPTALVAARLALGPDSADTVAAWAQAGVRIIHVYADEVGRDSVGRPLPEVLREVHGRLVDEGVRDLVTLVASGGIAAAEHVAKAIACGADLVAIDFVALIAWGTSLWADRGASPVEEPDFDAEWGAQRLVNLMNAWRDQLLEALGAMGMREVRRLRGEIGRTIWHTAEEAAFKARLGGCVPLADYPALPREEAPEGDFRWPVWLLHTTQQMARTGQPPAGAVEYRVGDSDGGFDRMAFAFELDADPADVPAADPAHFDMSLPLNRRGDGRPERRLPMPWYGAGMSYGSIGFPVMTARFKAAQAMGRWPPPARAAILTCSSRWPITSSPR